MSVNEPQQKRYIIMSRDGFGHPELKTADLSPTGARVAVAGRAAASAAAAGPEMRVIDSIREDGPKLVEMSAEAELSLRLSMPQFKIVPEVFYHRQWYRPEASAAPGGSAQAGFKAATASGGAAGGSSLTIVDGASGEPLAGAHVVVFTDFARGVGDSGDSGADGVVRLAAVSGGQALDRAYVYGPPGYWGSYRTATSADALATVRLARVDPTEARLLLAQLYGGLARTAGGGVTVGIIDTGVDDRHPALPNVAGGLNCVGDEVRADPGATVKWGPARTEGEHGTHVAGIVAGRAPVGGFRGVAPGATLRSYRVFPDAGGPVSNFDIAKALDAAAADGCDLVNMSLGGGPADDLTRTAIDRALAAGVVVVAASGNDGRKPVSYPAAFPECVAVSAMGRRGSFPSESIGTSDVADPKGGPTGDDFVADFSNYGLQVDATGAGVEIVSTLPGGAYGPMSGTSMATPAVTGFAAHLLSDDAGVRGARGAERSRRLKDLLYKSCRPEGFGRKYEGFGLPLPAPAATS